MIVVIILVPPPGRHIAILVVVVEMLRDELQVLWQGFDPADLVFHTKEHADGNALATIAQVY